MTAYEVSLWVRDVASIASIVGVVGWFVSIVLGCFVTVPKFDRLTNKEKGSLELVLPIGGAWIRCMKYSIAIALPRYVVHSADGIGIYSTFPYRSHASRAQIVLSYVFVVFAIGLLASSLIFVGLDAFVMEDVDRIMCERGPPHC